MNLKVITQPQTEPLSLEEAKKLLKIDFDDDDNTVISLIKQAREYCEDYQGKKYITQTLEMVLDRFPKTIEFTSCSPVQELVSFKYTDSNGVENAIENGSYILDTDSFINRIVPAYNSKWPSDTLQPINAIRIRFIAGYGTASDVPETVKWAMALHMRLLYGNYEPNDCEKLEKKRDSLLGLRRVKPV